MKILTPEHDKWEEFIKRLEGPEGCDFKGETASDMTWKCKGGMDKTFATAILKDMKEFDVDATLEYFEEHGGHCDCEIIFNIDPGE